MSILHPITSPIPYRGTTISYFRREIARFDLKSDFHSKTKHDENQIAMIFEQKSFLLFKKLKLEDLNSI